ncbi:AAA family ATPase [Alteribacillus sp. JSM 102045]|uniref:AAA family ATPase n=1 Tax=Alteribacillus sp. JSM 102045 TaxID=1562101 RepID=UPI0035C20E4F
MIQTKGRDKIQITINSAQKGASHKTQKNTLSSEQHYPLLKAEKSLDTMIGMKNVKEFVREMYALVYVNQCRENVELQPTQQNLHMLFIGNPGTGKTTVARIMADMLKEMKVIEKGHFIEAERADLVGEYIGQTAQKTRDLIKKAEGGILFIDEAYSLARGGEKDFGREAVDTLVKAMEDHQHKFILILAGYPDEMKRFLKLNPGLPSRFPNTLQFHDFTGAQMLELFKRMTKEKEYQCTQELIEKMKAHFNKVTYFNEKSHNGRYVRNLIERMIRRHAVRVLEQQKLDKQTLMTLEIGDFIIEEG